jgi:hypothetical protein
LSEGQDFVFVDAFMILVAGGKGWFVVEYQDDFERWSVVGLRIKTPYVHSQEGQYGLQAEPDQGTG